MSDRARTLRVAFASEEEFRREYASNIANGGIFVATNVGFDVREIVRVEIALDWRDECIELQGEIVHIVSPSMAGAGGTPGVAVQFVLRASDLRERFEAVVGADAVEDEREKGTGRRAARRARARVPVIVVGPDGREHEGRSHDISTSGVLVALDAEPIPIGTQVTLVVANPMADEEMELAGTVMRQVPPPQPGGPPALGIRFDVAPADAEAVELFLRGIQVAEHSRRLGGITGPIAEVGIENLMQMFGSCAPQGTLRLLRDAEEGFIMFEGHMLRAAGLGESRGRKALARLLEWKDGSFEFQARSDPDRYHGDPLPLDAAMLDALRLYDEGQRPGQDALPADARLCVDAAGVEEARDALEQADEAILDLAAVGMTVGKVIDVIPEPDVEVRARLVGLLARGLIGFAD